MSEKNTVKKDSRVATALTGVITGSIAVVITTTSVFTSNSVALIADAIGTFFECLAVLFSFLTLRKLSTNKGHAFDYGFGKLENLVSSAIGIFLFVSLSVVVFNAVNRFANPEPIEGFGVWLMIGAHSVFMIINGTLCWRSKCAMKEHASVLMESQYRLYSVKTFSNMCLLATLRGFSRL